MRGLALRRLGLTLFTVALVVILTFLLAHLAPGEPLVGDAELHRADPAAVERQRREFGLDRPLPAQFARYAGNVLRGNLGESFAMRRPVATVIAERLPNTLLLGGAALLLSFAIGITAGTIQAARRGSRTDRLLGALVAIAYATPSFWLGLVLLFVFGQVLHWLPIGGMTDPVMHEHMGWAGRVLDVARHTALPALTLGLINAAAVARFQRGALADVLAAEWIRTARAKGLSDARVLLRHGLRGALAPVVTLAGLSVPALLAGSVLVESVFGWPGMGRLMHEAILARDYNIIVGIGFVTGLLVALGNLAADLGVAALDPRERDA